LSKKIQPNYTGESTLYKLKNTYYLTITKNNLLLMNPKIFDNLLGEYGVKVPNVALYEGYLNEYGTKMIEYNAIEVLNSYF
jgi:adapter protein MecA 1/2